LYNHSVWDQADDVWQVGQILATLVKGCVEGPIGKREVKGLPCSSQLKAGRLWTRRADAARLVLRCGGRVSGAVSARTDVIVQGAISSSYVAGTKGVKLIEAEAYRQRGKAIAVISEARFRHLGAEHG